MAWTFDEKSPIYLQIAKNIKIKIVSQEMKQGEQLPTVRDYAQEAGVNPNTMQRAFTELELEGIVFSRRTAGRFVTEDEELIKEKRVELAEDEIAGFASNMANIGFSNQEILEETKKYLMNQSEKQPNQERETNMEKLLQVHHVSKAYGQHQALDDVSLTVSSGKIIGLLGPNGSGKTTLIKLINGLLKQTSGDIVVDGFHPSADSKNHQRCHL